MTARKETNKNQQAHAGLMIRVLGWLAKHAQIQNLPDLMGNPLIQAFGKPDGPRDRQEARRIQEEKGEAQVFNYEDRARQSTGSRRSYRPIWRAHRALLAFPIYTTYPLHIEVGYPLSSFTSQEGHLDTPRAWRHRKRNWRRHCWERSADDSSSATVLSRPSSAHGRGHSLTTRA